MAKKLDTFRVKSSICFVVTSSSILSRIALFASQHLTARLTQSTRKLALALATVGHEVAHNERERVAQFKLGRTMKTDDHANTKQPATLGAIALVVVHLRFVLCSSAYSRSEFSRDSQSIFNSVDAGRKCQHRNPTLSPHPPASRSLQSEAAPGRQPRRPAPGATARCSSPRR